MDAIVLPIEVRDQFSNELSVLSSRLKSASNTADGFESSLGGVSMEGDQAVLSLSALGGTLTDNSLLDGIGLFDELASAIDSVSAGLESAGSWLSSFGGLLNSLDSRAAELFSGISDDLNSIAAGFSLLQNFSFANLFGGATSVFAGVSSLWSGLFGRGGLFGGPDDAEMLDQAGRELASIFGSAFDREVMSAFTSVINSIPRAESGGLDVLAATWHPETILQVLENIDSFSSAQQLQWVKNIEDHVRPVLQNTLGLDENQTADMIAPLLEQILSNLAPGAGIHPELQRLMDWAASWDNSFPAAGSAEVSSHGAASAGDGAAAVDYAAIGVLDPLLEEQHAGNTHLKEHTALLQEVRDVLMQNQSSGNRPLNVKLNLDGRQLLAAMTENGGDVILARAINDAHRYKIT